MVDYSLTLESLVLITCSEVNIWKEWARRYRNNSPQSDPDIEKQADTHLRSTECVGSVVGYREDPGIYSNCLKSYVENCDYCMRVLVLGVDGNQAEDLSMIEVAEKVCYSRMLTNMTVVVLTMYVSRFLAMTWLR